MINEIFLQKDSVLVLTVAVGNSPASKIEALIEEARSAANEAFPDHQIWLIPDREARCSSVTVIHTTS